MWIELLPAACNADTWSCDYPSRSLSEQITDLTGSHVLNVELLVCLYVIDYSLKRIIIISIISFVLVPAELFVNDTDAPVE